MADNIKKENAEPVKRKPGRPRKKLLKEPQKRQGILDRPNCDKHVVEFLYDRPTNFNKICKYWKSLNTDKIKFVFTKTALILYTNNYGDTNDVGIRCDGALMNQYWCGEPMNIGVSFANIELIFNKLDKTYESISFVIRERTKNKILHIILQNDVDIPEYYDVEIFISEEIGKPLPPELFPVAPVPYSLDFRLPGKYFKKMISDARQIDKQWTIEKYGDDGNLMFVFKSANSQVSAKLVPKNLDQICLKSTVTKNEIFSVSVYIDRLKPTSSSQLADFVYIKASKDQPLRIVADLDEKEHPNAMVVNAIIKIVDHRAKP